MTNKGEKGFTRIFKATGYSLAGLRAALDNETAFKQELLLFIILTPVAFWLGESNIETAILIAALMLVLIVELLNSAIENTVDRISKERHEISGRAKDIASAAVFLSLLNVVIVWALLLTN